MSPHPLSQWLALGKQFMGMFKDLGEAGSAGFKEAGEQYPASQAQLAQLVKSTLDMNRELNELQTSACISMLQTQLGTLNPHLSSKSVQDLLDVHFNFLSNLSAQWKDALEQVAQRTNICVDELRKAQTRDDVSFTVASFLKDVGAKLRKDAEESGVLLNSASAAATILTHRALDELIEARAEAAGNERAA
jgi:hypothetical protein